MKVARKNEKKIGSWSQRAQTLNEKLRRCKAALFLRLSPNRRNNPTRRKKFARVENFRRSTTRKLLKKMKKKFGSWSHCAEMLNEKLRRSGYLTQKARLSLTGKRKRNFPKNLGLGPVAQRCLTKNSGDPVNSLKRVG